MKVVKYIFPISHRFRAPFHDRVRMLLAERGVRYDVVYSPPFSENILKKDTVDIPWGKRVPVLSFLSGKAVYQCALHQIVKADLIVVQQENRLLLNYFFQILGRLVGVRVAFFGHGKNWKETETATLRGRFKRLWATRVDWWFAYTRGVADYLVSLGYPSHKITTFNNSIDTAALKSSLESVSEADIEQFRAELGIPSDAPVGLFVGGLYPLKRLSFLIKAAERIRTRVPDFHLVIAGDGPDRKIAEAASASHAWIHYLGAVFEENKAIALGTSDVFLIPGLVGLAVLDALTAGLPVLTTSVPYHSPEIAYLKNGTTGYVLEDSEDTASYAHQVASLLLDREKLRELSRNARLAAEEYSIENMADRFVSGVLGALENHGALRDSAAPSALKQASSGR